MADWKERFVERLIYVADEYIPVVAVLVGGTALFFLGWVAGRTDARNEYQTTLIHAAQQLGDAAEQLSITATTFSVFLEPEAAGRRAEWLERMECATDPRACARRQETVR